jgi:hypothetical protein
VDMKWRCKCRLRPIFFGLSNEYIADVYEQFFLLKYHGGWSFIEAYNLPIKIRVWFLQRLTQQFEEEKKAHDEAMKASKSRRG